MKLQPNFSWQKYEGKPENYVQQFQFQLQSEHIQVANTCNATIDDESFFLRERMTSFVWIDNKAIWKKTLATTAWNGPGTSNVIPMGIVPPASVTSPTVTVIEIQGYLSDGNLITSNTLNLPHIDVTVAANSVGIVRNGDNIVITSGGTNYSTFSGYVTVYYTKNWS